jgi:hypothetical protein
MRLIARAQWQRFEFGTYVDKTDMLVDGYPPFANPQVTVDLLRHSLDVCDRACHRHPVGVGEAVRTDRRRQGY